MRALACLLAALAAPAASQSAFAPAGSRAVLTVEYAYRSEGRVADKYDAREWRVARSVTMRAELVAARPTPLSSVHSPDAAQQARNDRAVAQGEAIAAHLGGSLAGLQAAMEKCGEDEACLQKLAIQMAAAGAARPPADTQRLARQTEAAMKPDAARYQLWKATTQQGRYTLAEDASIVHADPICMERPGARCRRSEERRGGGELAPSASVAHAEVDVQRHTLSLRLPVPTGAMTMAETVVTDEPQAARGAPSATLRSTRAFDFRALREIAPVVVTLRPGAREQSGEFSVPVQGARDEGGMLAVRWRFAPP